MAPDESDVITHRAVQTLQWLDRDGRELCREDDPDGWASKVLDDPARIAELLDGAVERVSGPCGVAA